MISFGVTIYAGYRTAGLLVCPAIETAFVIGLNAAFGLSGDNGLRHVRQSHSQPCSRIRYEEGTNGQQRHIEPQKTLTSRGTSSN